VTKKKIKERAKLEADNNPQLQLATKERRLEAMCDKAEYQPPCSANQVGGERGRRGRGGEGGGVIGLVVGQEIRSQLAWFQKVKISFD